MKLLAKRNLVSSIICIIILFTPYFYCESIASEDLIYTRITEIPLPPDIKHITSDYNWTYFEFEGSCEIINPSGRILYISTINFHLISVNGYVSFENKTYTGNLGGPRYIQPAGNTHAINPGISEWYYEFDLSVNDTLDSLPNGNFTARIHFDDYLGEHNYHHFPSLITVNGSEIEIEHTGANATFTFPEIPPPTTTSYGSVVYLLFCMIIILLVKRRK